jgi:hypothetical protein
MLRQVVESEGKAVLACQRQEQLEIDWSAAECKTPTPQGQEVSRVYASADGVMVPVTRQAEKDKRRQTVLKRRQACGGRGRRRRRLGRVKRGADQDCKQIYISAIYDQQQEHRLVSVTQGNHQKLRKQLRRDAARVRLRAASEVIGLVDGAVCLRVHMEQLPLTALGLDFYHLSEHVHDGKRATFGEKSEAGDQWVAQVLHTVKHEGFDPFWEQAVQWRGRQRGGKREAADALLHYVAERKEMIDYPQFLERGWHIGTGTVESQCKATTQRVKGRGMRWDLDNAEAMLALEALYQSNQWDLYWKTAACALN